MKKIKTSKQLINEFTRYAKKLNDNLNDLNEPLVIEIAGTPRSGKSLSIDSLFTYFKRNKIHVGVVPEQASLSPISDKLNYFFNIY